LEKQGCCRSWVGIGWYIVLSFGTMPPAGPISLEVNVIIDQWNPNQIISGQVCLINTFSSGIMQRRESLLGLEKLND